MTETSIVVTPLQPPFEGVIYRFVFQELDKELAVDAADGEKIHRLLATDNLVGRMLTLSQAEDGVGIRISVVPS